MHSRRLTFRPKGFVLWMLVLLMGAAIGCGTAATATPPPAAAEQQTTAPQSESAPTTVPTPILKPTVTPAPSGTVSARDSSTLAIAAEPATLDPLGYVGGTSSSVVKDNMVDSLTWQSGDDLRIVPTNATVGWEQMATDKWRFNLREGVTFHNGEAWNAQAALPSVAYQGVDTNENSSCGYTGGHTSEAVDEFTVDINCAQACPIFPNSAFFLEFTAPEFFNSSSAHTNRSSGPMAFQ